MPASGHASPGNARPIGELLTQLRATLQAQAEAINGDDFEALERLAADRDQFVAELSQYTAADLSGSDRALAEQVGALDQQLVQMTRESLARTGQEMRDLDRGRAALTQYGQRGRQLIQNLAYLNQPD